MQDGTPCTAGVNISKCPFCEYHVAGEYKKMAPRRGGFTDSLLPTAFRRGGAHTQQGGLADNTFPVFPLPHPLLPAAHRLPLAFQ